MKELGIAIVISLPINFIAYFISNSFNSGWVGGAIAMALYLVSIGVRSER